jgi:phosphoribosylanthranilate isomerase
MLTQIYEVSTPDEARSISAIGIDHIGVLVGDGEFPRELSVVEAASVAAAIPTGSKLSALFLTSNITLIEAWARELHPAIVHLGAAPEVLCPDDVEALKPRPTAMFAREGS